MMTIMIMIMEITIFGNTFLRIFIALGGYSLTPEGTFGGYYA